MTGPELVAAQVAKAAAAGARALGEDPSDRMQLQRLAENSPALKAAASARARRIAVRQEILLRLWKPLAKRFGLPVEYFESDFARDLADKLVDVPEDQLIVPRAHLVMPAIQGLGYSLDEQELKDMYLRLIATASDRRKAESAHPSFAEVIRQLAPAEAKLLGEILTGGTRAIVRIALVQPNQSWSWVASNMLDLPSLSDYSQVSVWVDNWVRLGLAEVSYDHHMADEKAYDWAALRPEVLSLRAVLEGSAQRVDIHRGSLRITDFGLRFADAVLAPAASSAGTSPIEGEASQASVVSPPIDGGTP